MTEDIAIMRAIPNMVVIAPSDVHEARKVALAAARYAGPVYFRLGRSDVPVVTTPESPFEIGKAELMYTRDASLEKKVGIVVTGTLLYNALMAAVELEKEGIGASVLHMATIKPLDTEALAKFAADHDSLVTVEEHQIAGGLGSAVAEFLSQTNPTHISMIGMHDTFGQSGEPDQLVAHYGMDIPSIIAAAKKLI
jgi:transketolase